MPTKKAIALLYPPYDYQIEDHKKYLTITAQQSNFELIEIVNAKDNTSHSLQQLIQIISKQGEPVTLIIDKNSCCSQIHIIAWSVFGTLLIAGLIDEVRVYHGHSNRAYERRQQKLDVLEKIDLDFLESSSLHLDLATDLFNKNLFF